jgi:prolipoprotein diacylglyceryl transferase
MNLCVWLIVGGLIGARLGEVLFYEPIYYFSSHPLEILFINRGGLSSHGMTIGLLLTFWIWVRRHYLTPNPSPYKGEGGWKRTADILVIPIPLLAAFIRLGNFFNSEILGKPTNLPWGVQFPLTDPSLITRHPIQIYEALVSLSLFISIYLIYKKYGRKLQPLFITHLFFLLYFSSRFILEFWKADYQTSYFLTMGQFLSLPFIIFSIVWFIKNAECRMQNAE